MPVSPTTGPRRDLVQVDWANTCHHTFGPASSIVICMLLSVSSLASRFCNVDSTGMRNLRETRVISSGINMCEIDGEDQVVGGCHILTLTSSTGRWTSILVMFERFENLYARNGCKYILICGRYGKIPPKSMPVTLGLPGSVRSRCGQR